jgi:hypothetical protein
VLVNVQENTEFASHQLNRDTWQNSQVRTVLAKSFIFWQVLADDSQGHAFVRLYQPPQLPVIAVVDPRTRQLMASWTGYVIPKDLNSFLGTFLEEHDIKSVAPTRPKNMRDTAGDTSANKKQKAVMDMTDEEQLALALRASISEVVSPESSIVRDTPVAITSGTVSSPEIAPSVWADEVEPPVGPDVTQVQLRLPGGKKVSRRFSLDQRVEDIYRFVCSLLEDPKQGFLLVTIYPKKQLLDRSVTLQEARLQSSCLIVELT